jgi:hypothetical protein
MLGLLLFFVFATHLQINYTHAISGHIEDVQLSVGQSQRRRCLEFIGRRWRQSANSGAVQIKNKQ